MSIGIFPNMTKKKGRNRLAVFSQLKLFVFLFLLVGAVVLVFKMAHERRTNDISEVQAASAPASARDRFHLKRTASAGTPDIATLPTLKWSFKCPNNQMFIAAPPIVAGSTVYFMCEGYGDLSTAKGQGLYALNIDTGAVKWRNPGCNGANSSTVLPQRMEVIGDSSIYTSFCSKIMSLKTTDGSIRWQRDYPAGYTSDSTILAPATGGQAVYYTAIKGTTPVGSFIAAINKSTGVSLWPQDKFYPGVLTQNLALEIGTTETLYAAGDTRVQAIKGSDGSTIWSKTFSGEYLYSPSVQYSTVFVGSHSGKVYAFDQTTGAQKWVFQADGQVSPNLTVGKGQVAFATDTGSLYSINTTTGAQIWKVSYGEFSAGHYAPYAWMTDNIVYLGNAAGKVKAFDRSTGALKWTTAGTTDPHNFISEPVVINGRIYVTNESGRLRVF